MIEVTTDPNYQDLKEENRQLKGRLKEARLSCRMSWSLALVCMAMSAASTLLLVLTWSGYIMR